MCVVMGGVFVCCMCVCCEGGVCLWVACVMCVVCVLGGVCVRVCVWGVCVHSV